MPIYRFNKFSCCNKTKGKAVNLDRLNIPIFRIVILIAFLRTTVQKKRIQGGLNSIDRSHHIERLQKIPNRHHRF